MSRSRIARYFAKPRHGLSTARSARRAAHRAAQRPTAHRHAALGLAAVAAATGLATGAGPMGAAGIDRDDLVPAAVHAAATRAAATQAEADRPVTPDALMPAEAKIASYVGALQPNGWYCGPAATRIALSAHGIVPSFDELAAALGTTRNGTASIFDVTRVLNGIYGWERYESVEVPGGTITSDQITKLQVDVVTAINEGDPVVANIKGAIRDINGEVHSYPGGHYVTITGYSGNGAVVTVTDPADRIGSNEYHVPVDSMAWWIANRGYTA